jgi:hypothetical protein
MSSVGYHMSVTRLPTAQDLAEEESGSCYLCPESVRRILTTMLDLSLLKSPSFLILAISGCLTMMGFYTPFVYLKGECGRSRLGSANLVASRRPALLSLLFFCPQTGRSSLT